MERRFYNQTRRYWLTEADISMPIISRCGTGGGNLPIVLETTDEEGERTRPLQPDDGGEITMTLRAAGMDVDHMPCVWEVDMQQTTGTLTPGGHPGSYNGQDALNDMLVVEDGRIDLHGNGASKRRNNEGGVQH